MHTSFSPGDEAESDIYILVLLAETTYIYIYIYIINDIYIYRYQQPAERGRIATVRTDVAVTVLGMCICIAALK